MAQDTPVQSRFDPLSGAWRLFAAPLTLLVLGGLVSLTMAVGLFLPQIPLQEAGDPQAWLVVTASRLGAAGDLFLVLGLFDLFHTWWFRLLLVLTGLCLFVRAIESAELAWHATARRPGSPIGPPPWAAPPPERHLESPLDPEEIQTRLETLFSRMGYRWTEKPTPPVPGGLAVRRGMVLWARPLGYAALLLALAGLVIAAGWGWLGDEWQPVRGESQAVGHGTPYLVRLDAFDLQVDDHQRLRNDSSQITWLEGEAEVQQDTIALGRPSSRRGATVRQVGFVPVVRLRGWDRDGRLLSLETAEDALSLMGEVEIRFASVEARPFVLVPAQDLFLALTFEPICAEGRPALHVETVRGETSEGGPEKILYDSGSFMVEDLRFEIDLSFVPILRADFRPGMTLAVGGLALFVGSLVALWIALPRLAWISSEPGEDEKNILRVQMLPGADGDRQLLHLTRRLEEVLCRDG